MTDTVQQLIDKQQLLELSLEYCRAIDRRDFVRLRSLYHDDAIDDHGGMFRGSADEYVAWVPQMLAMFEATVHSLTNTLYVIEGDHAQGELYTTAYHRTPAPEGREIVIGGRYLDRYERRRGTWKYAHRSLAMDWCRVNPTDTQAYRELAASAPAGRADHEDPSYFALSFFRRGAKGKS